MGSVKEDKGSEKEKSYETVKNFINDVYIYF